MWRDPLSSSGINTKSQQRHNANTKAISLRKDPRPEVYKLNTKISKIG